MSTPASSSAKIPSFRREPKTFLDRALESNWVPDQILAMGIRHLLRERLKEENHGSAEGNREHLRKLIAGLRQMPIAINTAEANEQHYEVPTRFYELCLGPRLKYSSGYFVDSTSSLQDAEEAMLKLSCERAELADGQTILELGCGWGSLTLWMAEHFPQARIVGVSNSRTQREYIMTQCARRNLRNVDIQTCDMNHLEMSSRQFDRVVSVEMFEHMKNYHRLMENISHWLKPDGKLFVHIFTHLEYAYHFVPRSTSDWMARYFFTGGIMPSDDLLLYFQDHLVAEDHWRVSGIHYERTARHWLSNMDRNEDTIRGILRETYGVAEEKRWWVYWRVFFLACAELWGFRDGNEWMISHYRFRNR